MLSQYLPTALRASQFRPVTQEFQGRIRNEVCGMRYEVAESRSQPRCGLSGLSLGDVGIIYYESSGRQRGTRTVEDIRRDGADYFMVSIPIRSVLHSQQNDRVADTVPGGLTVISTRTPFSGCIHGVDSDKFAFLQVRVPGPAMRLRLPFADALCNEPASLDSAAGRVVKATLDAVLSNGLELEAEQARRCGTALVDLIANSLEMLAREPRVRHQLEHPRRAAILLMADSFIEGNLSDSELDVAKVAEHCRISARHLQKAFSDRAASVAAYIREQRLERSRDMLRDPRQRGRTVLQIAMDCGFSDASHFSRLYRTHFGRTPAADRG